MSNTIENADTAIWNTERWTGTDAISELSSLKNVTGTSVQRFFTLTDGSEAEVSTNMEYVLWLTVLWFDKPDRFSMELDWNGVGELLEWRMAINTGSHDYPSVTRFSGKPDASNAE